jgi:DNA-binding XRE family transcriptional regulator
MRKKMKKKKQTGKRGDLSIKEQMGHRFRKFREAIDKTQIELAKELKVYQSTITNMEVGKTYPGIKYLHQLSKNYLLNADWIVNGRGKMFGDPIPIPIDRVEKYINLLNLMEVPVVEQLIMARLEEVKVIARKEIKSFLAPKTGTDPGTIS